MVCIFELHLMSQRFDTFETEYRRSQEHDELGGVTIIALPGFQQRAAWGSCQYYTIEDRENQHILEEGEAGATDAIDYAVIAICQQLPYKGGDQREEPVDQQENQRAGHSAIECRFFGVTDALWKCIAYDIHHRGHEDTAADYAESHADHGVCLTCEAALETSEDCKRGN